VEPVLIAGDRFLAAATSFGPRTGLHLIVVRESGKPWLDPGRNAATPDTSPAAERSPLGARCDHEVSAERVTL
jgi:hypothetical protein